MLDLRNHWWAHFSLLPVLVLAALAEDAIAADPRPSTGATLAILFFDYTGKDTTLEPLRDGLAQMLISDLSALPGLHVVERARLKALLDEQKLGKSGKVSPESAARVGKLLGARFLVMGGFFDLMKVLRLDARVIEVETGRIVKSVGASGPVDDFWAVERDLATKLGDTLARELPAPVPAAIAWPSRPARLKGSIVAVYGKALAAADAGKIAEAKTLLRQVVLAAPQFKLASRDLDRLLQE